MSGMKIIYSRDGTALTDIRAAVSRSVMRNDYGEAIFTIASSNAKCKEEYLKWGNFILLKHDTLPDWVGIIDTPRAWHTGDVEVHAFGAMYILKYRTVPLNYTLTGTPGEKVTELIGFANEQEDTLIRMGTVTTAGTSFDEVVNGSVYEHIKKIQEASGHDWTITPNIDSLGKLTITLDWLEKIGVTTDLELSQGHNIQYGDTPLDEAGEIINCIEAVSDVQGGTQLTATYRDEDSISKYGLRSVRKTYRGLTTTDALTKAAKAEMYYTKEASIDAPLVLLNVGDTFKKIGIGNTALYKYTNVGFDETKKMTIRMEGYRFDEALGTVELSASKYRGIYF